MIFHAWEKVTASMPYFLVDLMRWREQMVLIQSEEITQILILVYLPSTCNIKQIRYLITVSNMYIGSLSLPSISISYWSFYAGIKTLQQCFVAPYYKHMEYNMCYFSEVNQMYISQGSWIFFNNIYRESFMH